ncbi:SDR family oxidoreductase [Halobacteriales archaeon Cl-PHB]
MQVAILGCGYVGLELGRQLTPDHEVWGVRRSEAGLEEVEAAGCTPVEADVTEDEGLEAVPSVDAVVFAASSGGRDAEAARDVYCRGQETAIDHFAGRETPPDRYVYTSSTGVYGDHGGDWVDEETTLDPVTEKTEVLAEAERIALERTQMQGIDGTVARLAGIYGPGRNRLERYVEGPVTEGYLNMIHRDDAAGVVAYLLENDLARDEVVLAVDDDPVTRWELGDWLAEECGEPEPTKVTREDRLAEDGLSEAARRRLTTSKRCSNAKLRGLGYDFRYPTYREGYRAAVEEYLASK